MCVFFSQLIHAVKCIPSRPFHCQIKEYLWKTNDIPPWTTTKTSIQFEFEMILLRWLHDIKRYTLQIATSFFFVIQFDWKNNSFFFSLFVCVVCSSTFLFLWICVSSFYRFVIRTKIPMTDEHSVWNWMIRFLWLICICQSLVFVVFGTAFANDMYEYNPFVLFVNEKKRQITTYTHTQTHCKSSSTIWQIIHRWLSHKLSPNVQTHFGCKSFSCMAHLYCATFYILLKTNKTIHIPRYGTIFELILRMWNRYLAETHEKRINMNSKYNLCVLNNKRQQ